MVALTATDGWFSSVDTAQGGCTGEHLADDVDRYGCVEFTQVGPTTVIETRAGYEVAGAERVDEYTPEPFWALDRFVIVEEAKPGSSVRNHGRGANWSERTASCR